MQLRHEYPVHAVGGSCIVLREYDPSEGVIDLDVDLDALPAWGRLCVSAKAVRAMADLLGYSLSSKEEIAEVVAERDALRAEVEAFRIALRSVAEAVQARDPALVPGGDVAELQAELEHEKASKAAVKGHLTRARAELAETEAGVDGPPAEADDAPVPGGAGASSEHEDDEVSPDAAEASKSRSRKK